jgi:hypothetical protein
MANFGYTSMKSAMNENRRVGNWKDTPVYATMYNKLPTARTDVFYIVFDDDNALVKDGKRYGRVTSDGNVHELDAPTLYKGFKRKEEKPKAEVKWQTKEPDIVPAAATASLGDLDLSLAQIEKDIQDTLNGVMNKDIFAELDKFKYDY